MLRLSRFQAFARRTVKSAVTIAVVSACGGVQLGSRETPTPRASQSVAERSAVTQNIDAPDFYRRLGLLAQAAPVPFTGTVSYLAAARPDSTHVLVALSLASTALRFKSEGDGYRADYRVTLALKREGAIVARIDASQPVRVASLRETHRQDESIVFQQLLTAQPGQYVLAVVVQDEGSTQSSTQELGVRVPAFADGSLSAPLVCYDATARPSRDSLPQVVMSPRAAATVGRDSSILLYLEGYGPNAAGSVALSASVDGQSVWSDTVKLAGSGDMASASTRVPVARLGLGAVLVSAWRAGTTDSSHAVVFASLGDDVPATTYADMISYLRHFASPDRLNQLSNVAPPLRGEAWADFMRETDPLPNTPENEKLDEYFSRLRKANERFQGEGVPGWRTDRGMVLLLLGEPDMTYEAPSNDVSQRGRSLFWEYRAFGITVEYVLLPAANQWRLTTSAESQVRGAAKRANGT